MHTTGSSRLEAEPDPVIEGQDVSIHYEGDDALFVSIDGGAWQEVPLTDGKGKVPVPIGAQELVISDRRFPSQANVYIPVINLGS